MHMHRKIGPYLCRQHVMSTETAQVHGKPKTAENYNILQ